MSRCVGIKNDKVQRFPTYSPKILAGINQLEDVLRDRAVVIRMFRQLPGESRELYSHDPVLLQHQAKLRDYLYSFALQWGPELA